ncbi:MAG TPA: hypothetical protein VHM16_05320 [Rubrobacteraceae bacterium]|nr:hypothetical protein [Rubrobacteraceae bacterium]
MFRSAGGPRLELGQSLGAFASADGDISLLFVFIEVANVGEEAAAVAAVRISPKGDPDTVLADAGEGSLEGEPHLPHTLAPGETSRLQVPAKALAGRAKDAGHGGRPRLEVIVEEADGTVYRKSFGFRVDEYLRLKDQ